ncbi:MAG: PQQ-binding-like beta-propeller repeat protein, partial [Bacteroidetes bacterium]|nr:PQQ-binding-like beta-propeller repeat protein [Bacteroidota bacterium]
MKNILVILAINIFIISIAANAQELEREFTHTVWKYKTRGGILSSPVISEGIAYFGCYNKNLYALDLASGQEKWRYKTKNHSGYSPAIGKSTIYYTSHGNYLYAVDIKTGQEKWKFKAKGGALSSPIVVNEVVFFGSYDKYFYAVDAKTGQLKWKFKTKDGITSLPAIAGGMAFFGSYGKYLHAVDVNTGKDIWKIQLHANVRHAPVISEGIVYFGSYDKYLYAVDAKTGLQKWSFKTKGGVLSTPTIADDIVYISCHGKLLYAVNKKTGGKIWQFKTKGDVVSSPIVFDDKVYFGTRAKYLYAVNAKTGLEEWKYRTHGGVLSSPTVSEGVVYFGCFGRKLYALQRISLINVYGKVTNAATGQPIQTDLTIYCLDNDQIIGYAKNDPETGNYIITYLDTVYCHQYRLLASDPFLLPDSLVIGIFEAAELKDINFDLELLPISGTAKNVLTDEPIQTKITIKCIDTDQEIASTFTNPKDGSYKITIAGKDCFKYAVIASDTTLFPGGLIIDIFEIAERKDLTFDLHVIPISGKVTNVLTGKPIETEIVVRCADDNKIISVTKTNPVDGSYNMILAAGDDCFKYEVLASDTVLFPGGLNIETIDMKGELKNLNFDLSIIQISGKVTNVKTKKPVKTEVTVICLENGE